MDPVSSRVVKVGVTMYTEFQDFRSTIFRAGCCELGIPDKSVFASLFSKLALLEAILVCRDVVARRCVKYNGKGVNSAHFV